MEPLTLKPIPLIHNGDSYLIEVQEVPSGVRIVSVEVFINNELTAPTLERFSDLDPSAKRAVVAQVNRRFEGKMIYT